MLWHCIKVNEYSRCLLMYHHQSLQYHAMKNKILYRWIVDRSCLWVCFCFDINEFSVIKNNCWCQNFYFKMSGKSKIHNFLGCYSTRRSIPSAWPCGLEKFCCFCSPWDWRCSIRKAYCSIRPAVNIRKFLRIQGKTP